MTLKIVEQQDLTTARVFGDYLFDEFLKKTAERDKDIKPNDSYHYTRSLTRPFALIPLLFLPR